MKYLSLTDLPELTREADRAQAFLSTTMDDLERMPPTSIEFRLKALDKITDFIYRLTAVRKTLAALRASFTVNTNGLRALTEMMRTLHAQMGDIQATMNTQRTPRIPQPDFALKLPADWNLNFKRFSPDWPPTEDELIPEPSIPNPLGAPASFANESATTEGGHSCPPQTPSSHEPAQPDPLTALAARIPESITNPNFELPEESNNANDYAPLLGMDLVPHTRAIPTLPLASPNLQTHFQTQFAHLTDTCVNLRNDIDQEHPDSLSILKPSQPTNEEPSEQPEDEQDVIREFESILEATLNPPPPQPFSTTSPDPIPRSP